MLSRVDPKPLPTSPRRDDMRGRFVLGTNPLIMYYTMKKQILGIIKDATQVKQFEKKNGQTNVKCVLHIMAPADEPYPEELAVTVCGDLTLYAAAVGSPVAVDYIVRVFSFEKDGKKMYGNDVYATAIQPWQP